jgi:hypothetical protein
VISLLRSFLLASFSPFTDSLSLRSLSLSEPPSFSSSDFSSSISPFTSRSFSVLRRASEFSFCCESDSPEAATVPVALFS